MSQFSILVVEDDEFNQDILQEILSEYAEYAVTMVNDGIEALNWLTIYPNPDLVLLDMMMPNMDGFELLEELRQRNLLNKLRIIGLSARAQTTDREKALAAGCWYYLTKPFDIEEVENVIAVGLTR